MLTMSQINHIKDLSNCGYRISEISKKTGADPKTIRKYRRSHPNWIPSSPSSRSGWTKTRNIGESSTIPLRESMSVSWRNMAIPGVTALSNAT